MLLFITNIFKILGVCGLYVIISNLNKGFAIYMICKHPELSDEKVKYITTMLYKDKTYRKL